MDKPKQWPQVPAEPGKSYGVQDPVFPTYQLAVMLMSTWLDFGTRFEAQRRRIAALETAAVELKTTNDVLARQLADLKTKHENLREAVRKERLGKVSQQVKAV